MREFWIKAAMTCSALCWSLIQASAASVFSYAHINVPFEVRVDGIWVDIIETREAWEEFYIEKAEEYLGQDSELLIPPEFDFETYTVIAGGLGAGSSGRSLMIEHVKISGSTTYVSAVFLNAGSGCVITGNVTYPTIVILIPKPQSGLHLHSKEAVFNCE